MTSAVSALQVSGVKDYKGNPTESSLMAVMYDASLDNFVQHNWELHTKPYIHIGHGIMSDGSFYTQIRYQHYSISHFFLEENLMLSAINLLPSWYSLGIKGGSINRNDIFLCVEDNLAEEEVLLKDHSYDETSGNMAANENSNTKAAKIRKDFNETAFFYPDLRTDKNGDATFTFTMPDALTRWKLKILAYDKDLKVGNLRRS